MDRAAALGVELFVIDAGWYAGAGAANIFDFDAGLGSWEVDPVRFPSGLEALTDYAHALGMKIGVWVEPERVNLSVVDDGSIEEAWLATQGGAYGSDHAAQICLAGEAGRQWMLARLTRLLDTVKPDYLKWDNNMWVNCDRTGHGHGATDGNFAHVTALYKTLDTLRQRYPNLLIENVSGGGNRLDFGMLRYSDTAWMDDRTAPSVHVRHNLEGLSAAFPPAYLLSFVTDHDGEPLHDAPDLALYFRSRMGGSLGLCFRTGDFSDDEMAAMGREIAVYKTVRTMLSAAAGSLLTPQAAAVDGPDWDALQAASSSGAVVYAYEGGGGSDTVNVKPTNLQPDATYLVQSVDAGAIGTATGADLMANGIDVVRNPATAAHILTATVQ
jgi:alpha-galactosidase